MFPLNVNASASQVGETEVVFIQASDPSGLSAFDNPRFTIFPGLLIPPEPEPPADVFVRRDGAGGAFRNVIAALNVANPGEIIEIQNDIPFSEQHWVEDLDISRDGNEFAKVKVRARLGDRVRIYSAGGYTVNFTGQGYYVWQRLILGDADLTWSQSDAGRSVSSIRNVNINDGSHHIEFEDCIIWGGRLELGQANKVQRSCDFIKFLRCAIDRAGSNNDTQIDDDRGDTMRAEAQHVIYEDCTFKEGGHENLAMHGAFSISRGCTYDADWRQLNTGFPGSRCAAFSPGGDNGTFNVWGPQLIERNIFKNAAPSVDKFRNPMMKVEGLNIIHRANLGYDNIADALSAANNPGGFSSEDTIKWHRGYHNTFYNCGAWIRFLRQNPVVTNWLEMKFKNNINDQMTGVAQQENTHVHYDMRNVPLQGHPDRWLGAEFAGNILNTNDNTPVSIYLRTGAEESPPHLTVAEAEAEFPLVWIGGNTEDVPVYVDVDARTREGFALASGSPGEAEAEPLTTIVSGGGTSIVVADSRYFYDGWNMAYFGEDEKTDTLNIVPAGQDPAVDGQLVKVAYNGVNFETGAIELQTSVGAVNPGDEIYWEERINKGAVG